MTCPKCRSHSPRSLNGDQLTRTDQKHLLWAKIHPAATLAALGLQLADAVAKKMFSTVYECQSCSHRWRAWFE
jgi:hypothetical protein